MYYVINLRWTCPGVVEGLWNSAGNEFQYNEAPRIVEFATRSIAVIIIMLSMWVFPSELLFSIFLGQSIIVFAVNYRSQH